MTVIGHVSTAGIDQAFQNQVREMLQPGTPALFMMVEQMAADRQRALCPGMAAHLLAGTSRW